MARIRHWPPAKRPSRSTCPHPPSAIPHWRQSLGPRLQPPIPSRWSRAGGPQWTAKEGETIYNLSRRFGVPADVLMKANGLSGADGLQPGQKIIIPTYVYNTKAPVSAPDNNPKVAEAKSSHGTKTEAPAGKLPAPLEAPSDKGAVLPKSPQLKQG